MLFLTFAVCLLLVASSVSGQSVPALNTIAVNVFGPVNSNTMGGGVSVDSNGNTFVGGSTGVRAGGILYMDFYVQKFSAAGLLLWANVFGTSIGDVNIATATDSNGSVYSVGICATGAFTQQTVGFLFYGVPSLGNGDACFAKFNWNGSYEFSTLLGGSKIDSFKAVAMDEANSSFVVAGYTESSTFDGTVLPYTSGRVSFLQRFDLHTGAKLAQYIPPQTGTIVPTDVVVDSKGCVWMIGSMQTNSFYNNVTPPIVSSGNVYFINKVSRTFESQLLFFDVVFTDGFGIAADNVDNIYGLGSVCYLTYYQGCKVMVIKYANNGTQLWKTILNVEDSSRYGADSPGGIALDSTSGLIYVSGSTKSATFAGVSNPHYINAGGNANVQFLAVMDMHEGAILNATLYGLNASVASSTDVSLNQNILAMVGTASTSGFTYQGETLGAVSDATLLLLDAAPIVPSALPTMVPTASPSVSPSVAPTAKPSAAPSTSSPTNNAPVMATFQSTQVISGITYATYTSDVALYSSTLISTIALQMSGVAPSDIQNFVAEAASSARGATLSLRALQASNAISISYSVSVNSVFPASALASQLLSSTENGAFDASLHAQASSAGATALQTATTDAASVTYPASSSAHSDGAMSSGAIAGIVIGVLAGASLLAALVWYFHFRKQDSTALAKDESRELTRM